MFDETIFLKKMDQNLLSGKIKVYKLSQAINHEYWVTLTEKKI